MRGSRLSSLYCLAGLAAATVVAPGPRDQVRVERPRVPGPDPSVVSSRRPSGAAPDSLLAGLTFDSVWSRVRSTYFDPSMAGVDWDAARAELRPHAVAATSNEELRAVLGELLGRLQSSHFVVLPGSSASAFTSSGVDGLSGYGEPGLEVRWIDGEALVSRVPPGGSADRSGVRPGWIVDAVGGMAMDSLAGLVQSGAEVTGGGTDRLAVWLPSAVQSRLRGAVGSDVEVMLRDDRDQVRDVRLLREAPPGETVRFGNLPPIRVEVDHRLEELDGGLTVGIIRFTAWFPSAVPEIATAVDEMRGADAIVLDLRGNPGGVGALVMGVGGQFLDEPVSLGTMRTREGTLEFVVNPQRVMTDGRRVDPYTGPLLILIDPLTASTSEIFAGGMQAIGRATIVGETSAGQALPALVVPLPNGDLLMHAVADFAEPGGTRIEGRGVLPDVPVSVDRAALLGERDPILQEALQWLVDTRLR